MVTEHECLGGFRLTGSDVPEGAGGQGTVCRAVCERAVFPGLEIGSTVALKIMSAPAGDEMRWRTLESTVAVLARLNSPNVVRYYGCFRERTGVVDLHVIVMELLEGETLKERLSREPGALDADVVLDFVQAVAKGLTAAVSAGLVHRDVKPDNIFLCHGGIVKVIDFGIARREESTMADAQIHGSFDYMAPERVDVNCCGDECSDVFSLGVVMHEALVRHLPYAEQPKRAEFAFFERWGHDARESALVIDGTTDRLIPGVGEVLRRALSRDRGGRFVGFAAFGEALARLKPLEISSDCETYRVLGLIGEGGFGEVFKARRLRDCVTVAIKHLRHMDGVATSRFRAEARAMAAMDDPSFVRFHEYFETGSAATQQSYLVMSCLADMPGRSLRDVLATVGRGLPVGETLSAFVRYAHGLAALHAHGIVHRDIKPSNLYFPKGDLADAVIMDLGVALDWKATLTNGMAPGTPEYMPPEVLTSASRGSSASDVYALGFCLYEALTGQPAFPRFKNGTSGSIEAFIVRARQMRAPKLDAALVTENPDLERLLRRMTEPDVARRMSNAAEVELELEDLLDAFERGEWVIPEPADSEAEASDGEATTSGDVGSADTRTDTVTPRVQDDVKPAGRGRMIVAALSTVLLMAAAIGLWAWREHVHVTATTETQFVTVVTQVVQHASVDTNKLAAAEALRRKFAEIEAARRDLAGQLAESEKARKLAESNAVAAVNKVVIIQNEQDEAKRLAEKTEAAKKAEWERKQLEEEARRLADERTRREEAERRREDYDRQMAIVDVQTSAVAIVRHYLDSKWKVEDVNVEREVWIAKRKGANAAPDYATQYDRALKLIDDAQARRMATVAARSTTPASPATTAVSAAIQKKLDEAELCLDDEDELGALRIYSEVRRSESTLPKDHQQSARSAFERYRVKNLEAQEIARSRPNSNYNEGLLKEELRKARAYLNVILAEEREK